MAMNRRNVLIGLGTIVAGGGAALGTGAFSQVEAERTVEIETASDAEAFLALEPARGENNYVDSEGDTIEIKLDGTDADAEGINQDARTRFEELVTVTNQGTQTVDTLEFTFEVTSSDDDDGHEDALSVTSGDATIDADGDDLLDESDEVEGSDDQLEEDESVPFGIEVELREDEGDITDIDDDAEITLTIEADTSE